MHGDAAAAQCHVYLFSSSVLTAHQQHGVLQNHHDLCRLDCRDYAVMVRTHLDVTHDREDAGMLGNVSLQSLSRQNVRA